MWEENFGTQAGVHLIEGVRLTWDPLNTGLTILNNNTVYFGLATISLLVVRFFPVCEVRRVNSQAKIKLIKT